MLFLAAALAALQAQVGSPDLNRRGAAVDRLHVWVDAVQRHQPGQPDASAGRILLWTPTELDDLAIDLRSLLVLMGAPRTDSFGVWAGPPDAPRRQVWSRVVYTRSELDRLRTLALTVGGRDPRAPDGPEERQRIAAAANRIVKTGAAMHTAIALNRPHEVDTRPAALSSSTPIGIVWFVDGRQLGFDRSASHWTFARRLLNLVAPSASADEAVRTWYRAATAALLHALQLHPQHFDEALRLFPGDPVLLLMTGSFHEALASPGVQAFVRSASLPMGATVNVGSVRAELGRAESLFRRALTIAPHLAEARVRLARVLTLQDRHRDALGELQRLDVSDSSLLQYYASLFAGDAAEALGRRDEARAAYERAAALYPLAHAPRFALSELAASSGDLTGAAGDLEPILSAARPTPADDPFWTYHVAVGRDAEALMHEAYHALTVEVEP